MSFVRQRIHSRNDFAEEQSQSENFKVFDLSLGVRLPRRRGIVSIELNNVFDEKFRFRDTTFEGSPRVPQYAPERALFARLQLNL
jgi:outer membrane receptor protein involved in Fe transport